MAAYLAVRQHRHHRLGLRWNYRQLPAGAAPGALDYAAHTAHDTVAQNVLKGWCASAC